jgi:hypothetical protein
MTDELELLRRANPVQANEGPWRHRPLDHGAEQRMNHLLHGPHGGGRHPTRTRRLVVSVAATAVVALAMAFSGAGTTPAVAAPVALEPQAGSRSLPLAEVARRAEASAVGTEARPRRGSHLQAWSLCMEEGPDAAPPVTVPEERLTCWNPDGSGVKLVVATDPRHPGRPVIDDSRGEARTVDDGKVLQRTSYPAGTSIPGVSGIEPPHEATALRAYLARLYGPTVGTTPELLQALSSFLLEWTPGPRENAAIAAMLADADGLRPVGTPTASAGRGRRTSTTSPTTPRTPPGAWSSSPRTTAVSSASK